MELIVFSDESGVLDRKNNDFFVFGGLVFTSYAEMDTATRLYANAEKYVKQIEILSENEEAKACILSNSLKGKLFRSLNRFEKFGAVVQQKRVNENIFNHKKSKQRYLDYVFKIGIKRKFMSMAENSVFKPIDVTKLTFYVDEHSTATNGRYELEQALEQEFKHGTFNFNYQIFYQPIFKNLQSVKVHFVDSKTRTLVRGADIIANRIFHHALESDLTSLRLRQRFCITEFP